MVAHIWKTASGYLLEIAEGNTVTGFAVLGCANFESHVNARRAARLAGARPWNY